MNTIDRRTAMRAVGAAGALVASASLGRAADPPRGPLLVELFTSQGCSSCPPADRMLGKLAERADVVALSFHVNYWDRLGWRECAGAGPVLRLYARDGRQRHRA
jgi:hypothetical protein